MSLRDFFALIFISITLNGIAAEGMFTPESLSKYKNSKLADIDINTIYSPDIISMKDGVVIFGRGCTGSVISDKGLILTNHHCGYESIQGVSTLEENHLEDGFWSETVEAEIPIDGLTVTFIDTITDVTHLVEQRILESGDKLNAFRVSYLSDIAKDIVGEEWLENNPSCQVDIVSFYGGNQFWLYYKTVYKDIRLVGTPPSSVGNFGSERDNWMWPRHTGDFALFRVYTDSIGGAAAYSDKNIPLKPKKFFAISATPATEGDLTFCMGFPGVTNRYDIASEVEHIRDITNKFRIEMRKTRLDNMLNLMEQDSAINLQYAAKYRISANYMKYGSGMNSALEYLDIIAKKRDFEKHEFRDWCVANNREEYITSLDSLDSSLSKIYNLKYQSQALLEGIRSAVEIANIPVYAVDSMVSVLEHNSIKSKKGEETLAWFKKMRANFANKDYNPEVDRVVCKAMLKRYAQFVEADNRPTIYKTVDNQYGGDIDKYVDDMFNNSVFTDSATYSKFIKRGRRSVLERDLVVDFANSLISKQGELSILSESLQDSISIYKREYIKALMEMRGDSIIYPDANFTMRVSFGNVMGYLPAEGVSYNYYTTLNGMVDKGRYNTPDYIYPAKLKELNDAKDYGNYADANGELRVCMLTDNDITGGNSGSPLFNKDGAITGLLFDSNWEGVIGAVEFNREVQRAISVNAGYILFIIDKFANVQRILDEIVVY